MSTTKIVVELIFSGPDAPEHAHGIVRRWLDFSDDLVEAVEDSGRELKFESSTSTEEPHGDLPPAQPIHVSTAKLGWMVLRNNLGAGINLQWQNTLDTLDLFFGFDPRNRRQR